MAELSVLIVTEKQKPIDQNYSNMQVQLIKTKDLRGNTGQVPWLPMNPRIIKDDKFAKLVKSIKDDPEMLELREVIAYDNDGQLIVICGNMRLRALQELGIKEVPTKILPKDTPIEKLKAYTIKDNVWFGEHDWELLANEWDVGQLADWGLDIDTPKEVDAEKELIEDVIPEEDDEIFVQHGDVYKLGNHTLMCGDSMNEDDIKTLLEGKNDAITHCISDPPYWIAYNPDRHGMIKNDDKILDYTSLGKKYSNGFFCMWTGYQVVDIWMQLIRTTLESINNIIIWHKWGGGMGDCARTYAWPHRVYLVK